MSRRAQIALLLAFAILPFALNGLYNKRLAANPALFWTVDLATWIVLPITVFVVGRSRRLFDAGQLGFTWKIRGRRRDGAFIAALVLAVPLLIWIDRLSIKVSTAAFRKNYWMVPFSYAQMIPPSGPATGLYKILATVYLALSAGIVEEFYYRAMARLVFGPGIAQSALYVIASAAVFSLTHWKGGVYTMGEALGVGLVAAVLFTSTRNIWPVILGHFAVDLSWLWT